MSKTTNTATIPKRPRGRPPGLRPDVWISGPDPFYHKQYIAWGRHKAQAMFRNEPYELEYDDWLALWSKNNLWDQRGKKMDNVVLTRKNFDLPWNKKNCVIVHRKELFAYVYMTKTGQKYKMRPAK